VPPLPCPLLHFMEERELRRGYPGGSVKLRPIATSSPTSNARGLIASEDMT
jgi:hypothetical protein